jgi:hypothetical protein
MTTAWQLNYRTVHKDTYPVYDKEPVVLPPRVMVTKGAEAATAPVVDRDRGTSPGRILPDTRNPNKSMYCTNTHSMYGGVYADNPHLVPAKPTDFSDRTAGMSQVGIVSMHRQFVLLAPH